MDSERETTPVRARKLHDSAETAHCDKPAQTNNKEINCVLISGPCMHVSLEEMCRKDECEKNEGYTYTNH